MELKITKDAALAAHKSANSKGKALLENLLGKEVFTLKITERIKTFDDVLAELDMTKEEFAAEIVTLTADEAAYIQLKLIAKVLNEGWEPDWKNGNQPKYRPWFDMDDASAVGRFSFDDYVFDLSVSAVGSRLCFKTAELATYAGKQFLEIYRAYMI